MALNTKLLRRLLHKQFTRVEPLLHFGAYFAIFFFIPEIINGVYSTYFDHCFCIIKYG